MDIACAHSGMLFSPKKEEHWWISEFSSVAGHLGCFHVPAVVKALLWISWGFQESCCLNHVHRPSNHYRNEPGNFSSLKRKHLFFTHTKSVASPVVLQGAPPQQSLRDPGYLHLVAAPSQHKPSSFHGHKSWGRCAGTSCDIAPEFYICYWS